MHQRPAVARGVHHAEGDRGADHQATDMGLPGDIRPQVNVKTRLSAEQDQDRPHVVVHPPHQHGRRAQQAEDRAGGAERGLVRRGERDRTGRCRPDRTAGRARGSGRGRAPPPATGAEPPQRQHVEGEVRQLLVQEHRRHQPVPLALRDAGERRAVRSKATAEQSSRSTRSSPVASTAMRTASVDTQQDLGDQPRVGRRSCRRRSCAARSPAPCARYRRHRGRSRGTGSRPRH